VRVRWFLAGLVAATVLGMVLFEVTMQPTVSDRLMLLAIFAAMVVATVVAAWWLPRIARRSRSLTLSLAALPIAALVVVTAAVALAADRMFLSSHDFSLLLVVLATGLVAAVVLAVVVSRGWARELATMRLTAARIAAGEQGARTGMERPDEIGRLASAIDDMAVKLDIAAVEKARAEGDRRDFLAAIGHDLRTPLASLRAAIEAVRDGVAPDPHRYLSAMESDVVALTSLVDNLFLLTRIEAGELDIDRSRADVGELADEAIEVLRPVAGKRGVHLRLEAPSGPLVSHGPEAVGRVLRNLLDNAIRYAPEGSEVLVTVTNGDGVTVQVTDEGPGFDPAFLVEAFQSFHRQDPARSRATGGAGLGLAIAHGFVTALGGSIWAEPGPGGTVVFRLPRSGPD
jgi:two-component system sensor histidine kinase BaeS